MHAAASHDSRVFRKLDLSSHTQLAAALTATETLLSGADNPERRDEEGLSTADARARHVTRVGVPGSLPPAPLGRS